MFLDTLNLRPLYIVPITSSILLLLFFVDRFIGICTPLRSHSDYRNRIDSKHDKNVNIIIACLLQNC